MIDLLQRHLGTPAALRASSSDFGVRGDKSQMKFNPLILLDGIHPHQVLLRMAFLIGALGASVVLAENESSDMEFFRTQVEPILNEKCMGCHSHAAREMEGGLALDSKSGWSLGGNRGPAVAPGKPDQSLIVSAIRYSDSELQMPPEEKLSAEDIAIIEKWVQRGAFDPRTVVTPATLDDNWWSLKKLEAPEVPGPGHPIDAFIHRKLAEQNLQPAPPADRVTLARRLSVDLHGVLPTPEEVQTFVDDVDSDAYPKLVDQFLASPQYGERWARHWLDTVHFADSHGCEHDVKRPHAWRYRDYVINRLNEDVSWGRFIREQLAVDHFFPNESHLIPALGFIAAGPLELSRAGTAPVTFDYLDRDDIVTQTMAAFVSTTANCARCHTHKFDPITQEDYYSLQAVFAGVGKGDIAFDISPEVSQQRNEFESLLTAIETNDADLLLNPKYSEIIKNWVAIQKEIKVEWNQLRPDVFVASSGATLTRQADSSIFVDGALAERETYTVSAPVEQTRLAAVRLDVLRDERLPKNGPGRAGNGNLHLTEVDLQWFPADSDQSIPLKISQATADFNQSDWTASHAIDGDLETGWAIFPNVDQSHYIVFELQEPVELQKGGRLAVTLRQLWPPQHFIGRFKLSATDAGNGAAMVHSPEVISGIQKPKQQRTLDERIAIAAAALEPYAKQKLNQLPARSIAYGVSSSWSHAKKLEDPQAPKRVHLLKRGAFDKPGMEVGPGALSVIQHLPGRFEASSNEAKRRAALAEWLAHHENPLTWRSIVNRVWHYHFGRGLSDTPNDFGRMGSEPTHPELLDWLAVWFRDEANGSLKELHRLILTSQTWQQSSLVATNEIDSENHLLWRMNRQRMEAEVFRDSVLKMGGRLDLTMGGPGIEQFAKSKGPQATPALDYSKFDWESPEATRRSIYRVVWRGIPDPFMEAMDFPDLGLLAPKRGFSVSALQSLSLFNNDFVLHGSRWIANRIDKETQVNEQKVARAVQLAWLRVPSEEEQQLFTAYVQKHGLPAFCRLLLNSNEFLFVE